MTTSPSPSPTACYSEIKFISIEDGFVVVALPPTMSPIQMRGLAAYTVDDDPVIHFADIKQIAVMKTIAQFETVKQDIKVYPVRRV